MEKVENEGNFTVIVIMYSRIFFPKPAWVENSSFQIDITFVVMTLLE
jgi:hypothetical protein